MVRLAQFRAQTGTALAKIRRVENIIYADAAPVHSTRRGKKA